MKAILPGITEETNNNHDNSKRADQLLIGAGLLFVCAFCFERLVLEEREWTFIAMAILALALVIGTVIYKHVRLDAPFILATLFLVWMMVGGVIVNGVTSKLLFCRKFNLWVLAFYMAFSMKQVKCKDRYLKLVEQVFVFTMAFVSLVIFYKASRYLIWPDYPTDLDWGIIKNKRLCGVGNSNNLAMAEVVMVFVSMHLLMNARKVLERILYILIGVLGWFEIGLTNTRTVYIAVAVVAGLFSYIFLERQLKLSKTRYKRVKQTVLAAGVGVLMYESFYIVIDIYQAVMTLYGHIRGNGGLVRRVGNLATRTISEDDGSLSDRTNIWSAFFQLLKEDKRRLLFGNSCIGALSFNGVYDKESIYFYHVHNSYLGVLHVYGLPGFCLMMGYVLYYVRNAFVALFNKDGDRGVRAAAAMFFGMMLCGITERGPLPYSQLLYQSLIFFAVMAYVHEKTEVVRLEQESKRKVAKQRAVFMTSIMILATIAVLVFVKRVDYTPIPVSSVVGVTPAPTKTPKPTVKPTAAVTPTPKIDVKKVLYTPDEIKEINGNIEITVSYTLDGKKHVFDAHKMPESLTKEDI